MVVIYGKWCSIKTHVMLSLVSLVSACLIDKEVSLLSGLLYSDHCCFLIYLKCFGEHSHYLIDEIKVCRFRFLWFLIFFWFFLFFFINLFFILVSLQLMLLRMRVGAFDFNFFSSNQVKLEAALTLMTGDSLGSCRTETEIVWYFSAVVFFFLFLAVSRIFSQKSTIWARTIPSLFAIVWKSSLSYNRNPYPNKKQRTNKTKKSQWIIGQTDTHFSEKSFIKKVWLLIKQDQEDSIENFFFIMMNWWGKNIQPEKIGA